MSEELKPCPFCGEKPATWHDLENTYYCCQNKNCLMSKDKPFMYLEWNNRPLEDALRAKLEEISELLEEIPVTLNEISEGRDIGLDDIGNWVNKMRDKLEANDGS